MIFVIDANKKPLAPCHAAVARKLLDQKKARVYRLFPFVIMLHKAVTPVTSVTHDKKGSGDNKPQQLSLFDDFLYANKDNGQGYRLKIDYGSKYTGLAILQGNKVIWLGQINHKVVVAEKMKKRAGRRRGRRNRKTRYRPARFLNRKSPGNRYKPSMRSKVNNIETWVRRLRQFINITSISLETAKFDTQLMDNPDIEGIEYQRGELYGYDVKEYLLEKFGRRCCYCKKPKRKKGQKIEHIPLEIDHIIPRSRGGTDRVSNLCIACVSCNKKKGNKTAAEFGHPEVQELVKEPLKDAASINSTRLKVHDILQKTGLEIEISRGSVTKYNRVRLGLPKRHYFDACCVGASTPDNLEFLTDEVLIIKARGRGSHSRTLSTSAGFPRGYLLRQKYFYGFQSGDMVKAVIPSGKYKGTWKGVVSCRKSGSFSVFNAQSEMIAQANYKYFTLLQRADGYSYELKKISFDRNEDNQEGDTVCEN